MIAAPAATLTHRGYQVDGQLYPRVSTICGLLSKPSLAYWRGKVGNEEADRVVEVSTEHGKRLHAVLEAWALAPYAATWERDLPADLAPTVAPFLDWWERHVAGVLGAEHVLVSRRYGYAGTADLLVTLRDGSTALVDYKSSRPYPAEAPEPEDGWKLQTAAYAQAAQEQDGLRIDRRIVLQLPREEPGALYVHTFGADTQAADWPAFYALLHLYRWRRRRAS